MKTLKLHIRRKKSAPDVCPECGLAMTHRAHTDDTLMGELHAMYSSPSHLTCEDVPGWPGHKTWFFVCYHMSGLDRTLLEASRWIVRDFVRRPDGEAEFDGGTYRLPIQYR